MKNKQLTIEGIVQNFDGENPRIDWDKCRFVLPMSVLVNFNQDVIAGEVTELWFENKELHYCAKLPQRYGLQPAGYFNKEDNSFVLTSLSIVDIAHQTEEQERKRKAAWAEAEKRINNPEYKPNRKYRQSVSLDKLRERIMGELCLRSDMMPSYLDELFIQIEYAFIMEAEE